MVYSCYAVITVTMYVKHSKQSQFKIKLRSLKVLFQNQVTWDCQLALVSSVSIDLVSLVLFKIHGFWRFHMKTHISFSIYLFWGEAFFFKVAINCFVHLILESKYTSYLVISELLCVFFKDTTVLHHVLETV